LSSNPHIVTPTGHTNRLALEKSPYLLQHAHNPVDWFAWGPEAFDKARAEDKPVFLSVGYSTCHWCHVMERESFESDTLADFLNQHFVSIKVDREERPDVDRIYMLFVQATAGQGGWPMNVFLTPELKPFFGGTYFPPDERHGRPGFLQLLRQIHGLWHNRRNDLTRSASELHQRLAEMTTLQPPSEELTLGPEILRNAGLLLKKSSDPRHGGFGGAPKFPQPSQPQFLLRYAKRFKDSEALEMVLSTCRCMAAGGIHDQLGGGFARYSVDAEWLVPHFEKMLYDNAQLAQLYLDAAICQSRPDSTQREATIARVTPSSLSRPTGEGWGEGAFSGIVRDILDYILRDMTHPEGGFYSAEDADSEGHEGKFYCWTRAEMQELLSPEEFTVASRCFGITEQGNFVDHSDPKPLANQNVLRIADSPRSETEATLFNSARHKMFEARNHRVRPGRDDKVLASWNGLMLGAFARAYAILGDARYRAAAEKNLGFIQRTLWVAGSPGILFHRWRDGQRDEVQLLEGHAFLLAGVLDLYEATLAPEHLEFAIALGHSMLAGFYDSDGGGFWQTRAGARDLILRVKEQYDGAEPSGNSVAILSLLRLGAITGIEPFTMAAEKSLRLFARRMHDVPQAVPYMLQALDFFLQEPKRVVVAGDPKSPEARKLLRAIHSVYQPNKIVLGNAGPVQEFSRTLRPHNGPLVYLCSGTSCQPPTADISTLVKLLGG
jgi:uncharacterized protein YyaL (SSP411 family)